MNEAEYIKRVEEQYAQANSKVKQVEETLPRDRYDQNLVQASYHLRQALAISAELEHPAFVLKGLVEAIEYVADAQQIAP